MGQFYYVPGPGEETNGFQPTMPDRITQARQNQNTAIGAMISASEATILRRTGAECPSACYVVQPPTPVNFPTNCCGQVNYGGNGFNNGCGNCGGC